MIVVICRGALGNMAPKRLQKEAPKSQILVVIYGKTVQEEGNEQQQHHPDFSRDLQGDAWTNGSKTAPNEGTLWRIDPKLLQKEGPNSQILVVIYWKRLQEESNEQQWTNSDTSGDLQGDAWKNGSKIAPKEGPEIADASADL